MYTDGDFGLHGYLPYLLVPFYPLFQERGAQRIERDQADWEVRICIHRLFYFSNLLEILAFPTDQDERRNL